MANITKAVIAATINKLRQSGRYMPQADRLRAAKDINYEASVIFRETVELWWQCFQNIGIERWQDAEQIALTMAGAPGIPQNMISTNLMGEALRRAEAQHVSEQIARNDAMKHEPITNSPLALEIWRWTRQMMAAGLKFGDYLPSYEQIVTMAQKLQMPRIAWDQWRTPLKVMLASQNVCEHCSGNCPFDRKIPVLTGNGVNYKFDYHDCRR